MAARSLLRLCLSAVLTCGCFSSAYADDPPIPAGTTGPTTVEAEFSKRIKANEDIDVLGEDLMGDRVSLYNGTLSFSTTDIAIPGNFALPVSIGRRYTVGSQSIDGHFGDWELDIPHLSATYSTRDGWIVTDPNSPDKLKRCSFFDAPPPVLGSTLNGGVFATYEFWHGVNLTSPDGNSREVLLRNPGTSWYPSDGQTYPLVTTDRWALRCLAATASGEPGEAFVAVSPDGTQYRFDWLVRRDAPLVAKSYAEPSPIAPESPRAPVPGTYSLTRYEYWMLPTRITDRFGNTVDYAYDMAAGADRWRLQSITASDGRQITLTYDGTSRRIATATVGTRTWTYTYNGGGLTQVERPDGAKWTYALATLTSANISYSSNSVTCTNTGAGSYTAGTFVGTTTRNGTVTHPSGAVGTFTVEARHHGRSFMPSRANNCIVYNLPGGGQHGFERDPEVFDTWALTSKALSGPGIGTLTWNYAYPTAQNNAIGDACGASCSRTKTVTVTDPEGNTTASTFGTKFQEDEGQLLKVESGRSGNVVRTTTYRHRQPTGTPYPAQIGTSFRESGDAYMATRLYPQDRRQITERDTTFTWEATGFDVYGQPTIVTRSSTLGHSRTETTVYHDNTAKWVLSQVATITEGSTGATRVSNGYDLTTAVLTSTSEFGQPATTMQYYGDGTLWRQTDGASRTTTFSNYVRGVAENVLLADNSTLEADVNTYGEIASFKNSAGYTTRYEYDAGGRVARIDYPDGDTPDWTDTVATFERIFTPEYGLACVGSACMHWKQTVRTGNGYAEKYFDALWRPVLTRVYDSGNEAATRRVTLRRFNSDGRETFASYPARNITSITNTVSGTATQYDAVGRVSDIAADWEGGTPYTTEIRYLDGFVKQIKNPRGKYITTTFQAFDEPDESSPLAISAPLGITTTYGRDVFGKPTSLTRSGFYQGSPISATRRYVYDPNQRLCKTIEPESGSMVQAYNSANLVAWRATGQNLTNTTNCEQASVSANQKESYSYDALNRLKDTTYNDSGATLPITRTYTPDGLLESIASDNSSWTTTYNFRRLPKNETLTLNGTDNYAIDYTYTPNGHAASLRYPDGAVVGYAPNALGEATTVGIYATQVTTHPNGALEGFRYGNNIQHTTQQNTRGLPSVSTDAGVLNDVYAYDENANVTAITDALTSTFTRTMAYDDLDRLETATGASWGGTATFSYDALDNLRTTVTPAVNWRHEYNATSQRLNRLADANNNSTIINYVYDARGRTTTRNNQTFTIDLANRVKAVSGKNPATYRYDGHGRRTSVTKAGTTTVQIYGQAGQLLYQSAPNASDSIFRSGFQSTDTPYPPASGGSKRYIYLGRHLIAEDGSAGRRYVHTDGLGSPARTTDTSGTPSARNDYQPYGWGPPAQSVPGFTGHVADAETGLSYMLARYYDPFAGRFLAVDPVVADGASFNRYWYANNNPYKNVDPDGRAGKVAWLVELTSSGMKVSVRRRHILEPDHQSNACRSPSRSAKRASIEDRSILASSR
ncbi:RHS repeat-associated core domain-containing protein [Tahibacter soli]|uniref:RHS repeat-associated core domain-containing protein n=1 Tax=Tahibacter soli TaxID=2983605 RepID=A0A9X4BJJ7_9GAMM|nr:RHS repeat-associated core domain-containing protein [Tahibacter soli]MDC8015161.1 RHS repeat-associated core domain-containing protein [Tahibacter soli]